MTCIISDHQPTTMEIRSVLVEIGHEECSPSFILPVASIASLVEKRPHHLTIVVLPAEEKRALGLLHEIRTVVQTPVVAVGPAVDPKHILAVIHAGADDYVDVANLRAELPAALQHLELARGTQVRPGHLIAVLAPSGGSGSSTVAVNLAAALAQAHKRTALIDLKLEMGDLSALLDLKAVHTLADLCQKVEQLDRTMFERSLVRHGSGVHLLAAPHQLEDVSYVHPDGIAKVLAEARSVFQYVVVDLDHTFQEEQIQVLRQASLILLVFRLDFTCLRNGRKALDYLARAGVSEDTAQLIVNRYGQAKEVPAHKAEEVFGREIFHYIPEDAKNINRANNSGTPAILEAPSTKVSRSFRDLATKVEAAMPSNREVSANGPGIPKWNDYAANVVRESS